jgi:hypothetical protein
MYNNTFLVDQDSINNNNNNKKKKKTLSLEASSISRIS